jgi:hypothetical protein
MDFLHWAGLRGREHVWEERYVLTARRRAWEAYADRGEAEPPPRSLLGPCRYRVRLGRTYNLAHRRPGERVSLRLPLPIEDAALGNLEVELFPTPDAGVETRISTACLDLRLAVPEDGQASIGATLTFTARPSPVGPGEPLTPAQAELFTRPNEGLIRVSDRIRALAADLAGGETDALAMTRRFWDFVMDGFACGSIHYDVLDPADPLDWVLEHGWCDCRTGSALLAALCRARGVPARTVTGYLLHEASPAFHTWVEAWIEGHGWLPFDLWGSDLSAGGRHQGWRDFYFGWIDHRMVVERPPRLFAGLGAARLPKAWHMLIAPAERGRMITFEAVDTGALAYREHIEVERLGTVL